MQAGQSLAGKVAVVAALSADPLIGDIVEQDVDKVQSGDAVEANPKGQSLFDPGITKRRQPPLAFHLAQGEIHQPYDRIQNQE